MKKTALRGSSAIFAFTLAASIAAPLGAAESYPARAVRILVSSSPGSGPDIMARLVGAKMAEALGQQVIVENRAGASGIIGTEMAAKAPPDGYTLLMLTASQVVVEALFKKLPYDLVRDFAPISLLGTTPFLLTVHPSLPTTSLKQLIALAKARPGELYYGSGGAGTPPHLATEILRTMTGIKLVHVPYKGITPALIDTVSGQVQMTFAVVPAALPFLKSGKLRALAVTSLKRTPLVPDVPPIADTVPGYEVIGWYSLVAPLKTPAEIIARLNAEAVKAVKAPDAQQRVSGLGAESIGSTSEELGAHMRSEIAKLRKAVAAANLQRE